MIAPSATPIPSTPSQWRIVAKWIKIIVFGLLSMITYFWIFYYGFGPDFFWSSLLCVLLFFLSFHFFYLQIHKIPLLYLWGILLLLSVIERWSIWWSQYLLGISALVINTGIRMLAYYLQSETRDKIRFSSWAYFNVGWYIFTVFITVGYSLLLLWFYNRFPLSCQDLSNASDRVVHFFTAPITDGAKKIEVNTSTFWHTKIGDVAILGQDVSLQTNAPKNNSFVGTINIRKKNLIDQALSNNSTVSMGICDYVLTELNKIYANPTFLTSVILLLFILLYSFVRIVFWVMTGLAFIIFKILLRLQLYRIKKTWAEVESIE